MSNVYKMKLKELYSNLSKKPNSPEAFIANVVYTSGGNRKKKLQGLYNIINGGPTCYWGRCFIQFASFSLNTLIVTPENDYVSSKQIELANLEFYA